MLLGRSPPNFAPSTVSHIYKIGKFWRSPLKFCGLSSTFGVISDIYCELIAHTSGKQQDIVNRIEIYDHPA